MEIQKTNIQKSLLKEIFQDVKLVENFESSLHIDHEIRKQELRSYMLDNDLKERTLVWKQQNINKVYWLCIVCLLCMLFVILLDGFKVEHFILPVAVMKTIIYTGVVSVLGLYSVVLYNLFPKNGK